MMVTSCFMRATNETTIWKMIHTHTAEVSVIVWGVLVLSVSRVFVTCRCCR